MNSGDTVCDLRTESGISHIQQHFRVAFVRCAAINVSCSPAYWWMFHKWVIFTIRQLGWCLRLMIKSNKFQIQALAHSGYLKETSKNISLKTQINPNIDTAVYTLKSVWIKKERKKASAGCGDWKVQHSTTVGVNFMFLFHSSQQEMGASLSWS